MVARPFTGSGTRHPSRTSSKDGSSTSLGVLTLGINVVIDYGLWGRDERSALRQAADDLGAAVQLRYFDVTPASIKSIWSHIAVHFGEQA